MYPMLSTTTIWLKAAVVAGTCRPFVVLADSRGALLSLFLLLAEAMAMFLSAKITTRTLTRSWVCRVFNGRHEGVVLEIESISEVREVEVIDALGADSPLRGVAATRC